MRQLALDSFVAVAEAETAVPSIWSGPGQLNGTGFISRSTAATSRTLTHSGRSMKPPMYSSRQAALPDEQAEVPKPTRPSCTPRPWILMLITVATAIHLLSLGARAAETDTAKHEVKLNAHAGDRWEFDVAQKSSSKTDINANGQQRQVDQAMSSRRKGILEVLAVKDGQPTNGQSQLRQGIDNLGQERWAGK